MGREAVSAEHRLLPSPAIPGLSLKADYCSHMHHDGHFQDSSSRKTRVELVRQLPRIPAGPASSPPPRPVLASVPQGCSHRFPTPLPQLSLFLNRVPTAHPWASSAGTHSSFS